MSQGSVVDESEDSLADDESFADVDDLPGDFHVPLVDS
jgi:hypothetical protein